MPDLLCRYLLVLALAFSALAGAAEIEIAAPTLVAVDDGYAVTADFSLDLNARLEEAVTKGVVLHFVVDFELMKPRWYWFDEKIVSRQQTIRLSYHALTRQYRVSNGGLHQSYVTLSEALRVLSRLRGWTVIDSKATEKTGVRAGETYQAALRIRLDVSQLPKPFQISAVGSRDWNLASDWKHWQVILPPPGEVR